MTAQSLFQVAGAIGPTGFALLAWGALLLVIAAFGYVVWALLADRSRS